MTPVARPKSVPLLTVDELATNLAGIRAQLERLLDFGDSAGQSRALLLDNGTWLEELKVIEFLRDVGKHFTVNQMVAKDSVRTRLERPEQGISYTEFSYMLLQAYDYLQLFDVEGCRLQVGASDQWGNITEGIELVRKMRRQEVFGLTTPLVLKADGTKFGKTESETVWLDGARTSPYQLYQFFFRAEDSVGRRVLRYFTFLDHDAIRALDDATAGAPRAPGGAARPGPRGVHARARPGRNARGPRRRRRRCTPGIACIARRAHAPGDAQGDALVDVARARCSTAPGLLWSTPWSRRDWRPRSARHAPSSPKGGSR